MSSTTLPDAGPETTLVAESLVRSFGRVRVVDGVSLSVSAGEVVGLLGPNGAGKTTTFYMIVGFLHAQEGRIRLGGRNITRLPMYRRARLGIGYLPQEPSVFRKLTVRENILAILETLGLSRAEKASRLEALLAELDITRLADRRGYQLSGGERRRVEITRALVTEPRFLLLDEPFVGIDPIAVGEIQEIIARLRRRGLGLLITDHSVRETLRTTDRAYILYEGKILLSGTSRELAQDPMARRIYLGERFEL
jgi:lipopolysaccharide export system ATP-binding protein